MRRCYKCGEHKPLTEFYKNRSKPAGHGYICKPCSHARWNARVDRTHVERQRRYKKAHPEYVKHYNVRKYRRLALEHLEQMCSECDETDSLHVHHKDGDRTNNELSNLEWLCPQCHLRGKHGSRVTTGRRKGPSEDAPINKSNLASDSPGNPCPPLIPAVV